MSLEMHAFLRSSNMPTWDRWQDCVNELGLPIELDAEMDIGNDKGFSPCKVNGQVSGFEIYFGDANEAIKFIPDITDSVGDRDSCITFRWGGDLLECACALAASAALAKSFDAVVFSECEGATVPAKKLVADAKQSLECWLDEA